MYNELYLKIRSYVLYLRDVRDNEVESEVNSMYYAISIVIISLFRPRLNFDVYFL